MEQRARLPAILAALQPPVACPSPSLSIELTPELALILSSFRGCKHFSFGLLKQFDIDSLWTPPPPPLHTHPLASFVASSTLICCGCTALFSCSPDAICFESPPAAAIDGYNPHAASSLDQATQPCLSRDCCVSSENSCVASYPSTTKSHI